MRKTISWNNHRISYQVEGHGKPLILLHGYCDDARIWDNVVPHLMDEFCIIRPDLPGFGESEAVEGISVTNFAKAVFAVLKSESVKKCVIIGHSMGGYVTLAFAEKWPKMLTGLGLFHSHCYEDSPEKKQARIKTVDFLARYATGKFIKEFVPNLFSKHTKKHHPEIVTKQMERVATNHIDGLTTGMLAMTHRKDRAKVLENTDCPVLIILGKEDTAVPLEVGLNQCSLPAISDVHILETGHMAMLEEPATAVDLVRSFSQKVW